MNEELKNSELTEEEMVLAGMAGSEDDYTAPENADDLVLDGDLGRWGSRRYRRPKRIIRTSRIGKNTAASLFRRQALERIPKMAESVQKKLITGNAQISDMQYYSCAEISGKGADLIDESVNRKLGLTNLDGGKIDKDKEFILSALKFAYDANKIDGAYKDAIPPEVYNGEWELQLDGKKVFDNMPMSIFADGISGYNVNKPYGYYVLNNPKHIKPQTTIELEVKTPANVNGFLKVYLIGTSVKPF